jgi:hypothetical protein
MSTEKKILVFLPANLIYESFATVIAAASLFFYLFYFSV